MAQHILSLRQVFSRDAMVAGVTGEGHRGIELTRGAARVRCRACGQEVARVADLASGAPWAPRITSTRLRGCTPVPLRSQSRGKGAR